MKDKVFSGGVCWVCVSCCWRDVVGFRRSRVFCTAVVTSKVEVAAVVVVVEERESMSRERRRRRKE